MNDNQLPIRELIKQAKTLGGHQTIKATVKQALTEYIQRYKQEEIISMFGQVDYDPDYDYKKSRYR